MFSQIPRLLQEVPLQQDIVFSRFAALYLPELVKTYLNPPAPAVEEEWNRSVPYGDMKLANAYGYMLVHLNGNPYFDRYFRMPQNRTVRMDLIMALIDRLHERAPAWEQREANVRNKLAGGIAVSSMIYDFCQLLCGILLFESEERVTELASRDKVRYLLTFLHWWDQRYNPQHASKFRSKKDNINEIDPKEDKKDAAGTSRWPAGELAMILRNGNNEKEKEAIRFARYTKGSIQVCGLQGCNRSYAMDGGALLQCSQCSTVRYVGETFRFA